MIGYYRVLQILYVGFIFEQALCGVSGLLQLCHESLRAFV